jgi:NAD(P)-dependent dehydrogenase (short-subunit alcohol dehydrogenase family)
MPGLGFWLDGRAQGGAAEVAVRSGSPTGERLLLVQDGVGRRRLVGDGLKRWPEQNHSSSGVLMSLPPSPRCVITGAASGFGRALALVLAARQARLVLADVDVAGCEETARLAREAGAREAKAVRCDVTRIDDVQALSAASEGELDLLINNAGVASAGQIGELPLDDWRWTLEVDLFGVIHGCHVFVPRLREQGHGHILNVASAAGLLFLPNMAAYNVAKAGVIALSETLRGELAGTRVGVTVACPTFFRTQLIDRGRFAEPALRRLGTRWMARGQQAEEVARAALQAVDRQALYTLPMADGRWLWRLKRLAPGPFGRLVARFGKSLDPGR